MKLTPVQVSMAINVLTIGSLVWSVFKIRKMTKEGLVVPHTAKDWATIILWTLTSFKFISGTSKVLILSFLGATTSVKWGDLAEFDKFCIVLVASAQALTHAEAFFDQTAAKLASGKPPIGTNGSGNTDHLTKDQIPKS